MNLKSKYIKTVQKYKNNPKKNDNPKSKSSIKKIDNIIIDAPKTLFKKGAKFSYNISNILQTNTSTISNSIEKIFICVYLIVNDSIRINVDVPYLKYLLFKYDSKHKQFPNNCIFPFVLSKKNKVYEKQADELVKKLLNSKIKSDGFIESEKNLFFFYNYTPITKPIIHISNKKEKEQLWWAAIDEICNQKKIIYFPIHSSVYNLFLHYSNLIYIKDDNGNNYEIPLIAYYGDYYKFIPIIATLGQKIANPKKAYDKFFYVTSFEKAIRYSCWTSNYSSRLVDDKIITDEFGKYKKGAVIRFAVFMNKTFCQRKFLTEEELKKWKWTEQFDSLYVGRTLKKDGSFLSIFPRYIIKDFKQHLPLSIHNIDPKKLPNVWNANSNFTIE